MSWLPESIDPWHAVGQGRRFAGSVGVVQLPRVSELLAKPVGLVRFELEFFRDSCRRHCVRGWVRACLWLVCQRCLKPVEVVVDSTLLLVLVRDYDEVARLPDEYDPLMVSDASLYLLEVVEDEILLGLPHIPLHSEGEGCEGLQAMRWSSSGQADHPFQVLEQLKKRLH